MNREESWIVLIKPQSLWNKNFTLLIVSNAFAFFGFQILFPTLPLFLMEMGGAVGEIGLVMGAFTLSAVVARPLAVWAAPNWGRKKLLMGGILLCCAAVAGYYFSQSIATALIPRILHGLGFGVITTIYAGVVSDLLPKERRGEGMGFFGLGTALMMSIAPFFGVWIMREYGYGVMFAVATGTQLLSLCMIHFLSPVVWPLVHEVKEVKTDRKTASTSWLPRNLWLPGSLSLIMGTCMGSVQAFVSLLAEDQGLLHAGTFFLFSSLAVALTRVFAGKIFDKRGPYWILIPGGAFFMAGLFLLSQTHSEALLLTSAVVYGVGIGALFPALQTWIINRSAPEKRTGASAVFYNCTDIGVGGGILLLGRLAEEIGYNQMYSYSMVLMAVFVLLSLVGLWQKKKA